MEDLVRIYADIIKDAFLRYGFTDTTTVNERLKVRGADALTFEGITAMSFLFGDEFVDTASNIFY